MKKTFFVKEFDINNLSGLELEFTLAISLGWKWCRNAASRTDERLYPLGSASLVHPEKSVSLSKDVKNWDGWLEINGDEELCPGWVYNLNQGLLTWGRIGPLIKKYRIEFEEVDEGLWIARTFDAEDKEFNAVGEDHIQAAARAIIKHINNGEDCIKVIVHRGQSW